eukprot:372452_1
MIISISYLEKAVEISVESCHNHFNLTVISPNYSEQGSIFRSFYVHKSHKYVHHLQINMTKINELIVCILMTILLGHALQWMQTSSYITRQILIGQYRVILGRFHGYTICVVCLLLLFQMYYVSKGSLFHTVNGKIIFLLSFFSITAVVITNILDIIFDDHLPMIWKLCSPIGDYLFAFYFMFCMNKSFKSIQSVNIHKDINVHIFWAKRFTNATFITLSVFPISKRVSKMIFDSQIYGGILAGIVTTFLFILDYLNGSNSNYCHNIKRTLINFISYATKLVYHHISSFISW